MIGEDERLVYALSVAPRVARGGDVVRFFFRTRNLGTRPTAPGCVRFALASGLEPLAAVEVPVGAAQPGAPIVAALDARVAHGLDDRTALAATAHLLLADTTFVTNRCEVVVRTCSSVDGDDSGTFVDLIDDDTVRVRVVVANDGDGPALAFAVHVGVPVGCERVDGDGEAVFAVDRLDAGASITFACVARVVAPVYEVRADDASVRFADGRRFALASRGVVALAARLSQPQIEVTPQRRGAALRAIVTNAGWVDALEVPVRVACGAGLRADASTLAVDGVLAVPVAGRARSDAAAARVRREADGFEAVVACIPARSSTEIAWEVGCAPTLAASAVRIDVAEYRTESMVAPRPLRDLRARIVDAPRMLVPGVPAEITVEVVNAGDLVETVRVSFDGDDREGAASAVVRPGTFARLPVAIVRDPELDGNSLAGTIFVRDESGECVRLPFSVHVRECRWLASDAFPSRRDDRVAYAVRNVGSTTCLDVVAGFDGAVVRCESIAPGERWMFEVSAPASRRGGVVRIGGRDALRLPPPDEARAAAIVTAFDVPAEVAAGTPFAATLRVDVGEPVDALVVRATLPDGTRYCPGSTCVDGFAILDGPDGGFAFGDGVRLRGVAGGTSVHVTWSLIADSAACGETIVLAATVTADDEDVVVPPTPVAVRERDAFPICSPGLGYHLDAYASPPLPAAPAPIAAVPPPQTPSETAFVFTLPRDGTWMEEAARLLRGVPADGFAAHVLAIRALFADRETSDDSNVVAALAVLRDALRDVFDRLYVKLRIPGFDVRSGDLEDAGLRVALGGLLDRLAVATPGDDADDGFMVRVDGERVRAAARACAEAPYGAPCILRALLALVPTRCDDEPLQAAALTRYREALDDALARWEEAPPAAFDEALAYGRDERLDDARAAVIAAFRSRTALVGAVA